MPRHTLEASRLVKSSYQDWIRTDVPVSAIVSALLKIPAVRQELRGNDDYMLALNACKNLKLALHDIRFTERYSGVRRGILAVILKSGVSCRRLSDFLKIPRQTLTRAAKMIHAPQLFCKVSRKRIVILLPIRNFIVNWIKTNTTPSSNTKNVKRYKWNGCIFAHVIHWRTHTLKAMHAKCQEAAVQQFGQKFSRHYFYKLFPPYIVMQKKQDGLCPLHFTGITFWKEFEQKHNYWHDKCTCQCLFCSSTGCDHGKSPLDGVCSMFTCKRCGDSKCQLEWSSQQTNWNRPVQVKRKGGGLHWANEVYTGTRRDLLTTMTKEMSFFSIHNEHNIFHKEQMANLLFQFSVDEIIIKADFIQNIVHGRGQETSQSYYSKRQTQFLSFVVWYKKVNADGTQKTKKLFVDYLSSYLKHNSLFFQKCLKHLLGYLRNDCGLIFAKVFIDTDGGKGHFKSRISFYFASTLPLIFGIVVHWIFSPSHHGKGDCDSHGAVVKKAIRFFVLDSNNHVDDEDEAVSFINQFINRSVAFVMDVLPEERELDCTTLNGSSKIYEMRFEGEPGEIFVRDRPCFCSGCYFEKWDECENDSIVTPFEFKAIVSLGWREPTTHFNEPRLPLPAMYKAIEILGQRTFAGTIQYQVRWEDFEDTTWVNSDNLNCYDLIEEFCIVNGVM